MLIVLFAAFAVTTAFADPVSARSRAPLDAERIDALLESPDRHVRGVDPDAVALLEGGARRSYTFARLLDAIEGSNLIVLVQVTEEMPQAIDGRLVFAGFAHGTRYVRIQIATQGWVDDTIATLGHELQHAVEVADHPEVRSELELAALYRRIGHSSGGRGAFDTVAARVAGRTVRNELG